MADEFRGLVVTTGTIAPDGVNTFDVQLPSDIQAGDYLFVFFGGSFSYRSIDHEQPNGPWTNIGSGGDHARIADGSEGGTTVTFLSLSGPFSGVRPVIAIALCYRFPVAPLSLGGLFLGGTLFNVPARTYSNPTGDSFLAGGQYGGVVSGGFSEFRINHAGVVSSDLVQSYNATSATWSGDLITDRTGLIPAVGGTFPDGIDAGGETVADSFYLSVPTTGSSHDTRLVVTGPGTEGAAFMQQWVLRFPLIVESDYWGILATP